MPLLWLLLFLLPILIRFLERAVSLLLGQLFFLELTVVDYCDSFQKPLKDAGCAGFS